MIRRKFIQNNPVDVGLRDNIQEVIYKIANTNPRPIILEHQFMDLANLMMDCCAGNCLFYSNDLDLFKVESRKKGVDRGGKG